MKIAELNANDKLVLMAVGQAADRGVTLDDRELVELTNLDLNSVQRAVAYLIYMGLVEKEAR